MNWIFNITFKKISLMIPNYIIQFYKLLIIFLKINIIFEKNNYALNIFFIVSE